MARFRFRLQPVLDRAYASETLARATIVDARLASDEVVALLAAVESRVADLRAAAAVAKVRDAGSCAATEAASIALSVLYRQRLRERERAGAVLARARNIYVKIATERSALECLRERCLEEHQRLVEHAESAEADEMNCLRSNEGGSYTLRRSVL